ncbi:MAG TPA: acetyl-CoA hydrolase/transferase C-terminal domain-containing protein, partial [Pseudoxanthomonas mexicana]|nr:acetyl-CoA hydrolase/transferase C-terminal domain-containing protein [Pseudoxanthomonas mexicana]
YGHTTIPRHLRDLYVNEYGIADLRGRNDEDCIIAMGGITDARFQGTLVQQAQRAGKLRAGFRAPGHWTDNTPVHLSARLRAFRHDGTLPDYPLGSDFTEVEQRIVKALGWLKANTATPWKKIGTVLRALGAQSDDAEAMARMDLAAPGNLGERIEAKLLALGLRETR